MPNVPVSALPVVSAKANIAYAMVLDTSNNPSLAAPALIGGSSSGGVSTLVLARNPLPSDDGTAGYVVGQFALNSTTGRAFIARSVATGAAVWELLGVGRHPGYLSGSAYYPEGMKINGANPGTVAPSTAGRILFALGTIAERVTITNFLAKASTGVAGTTAQIAVYKIDPTTKRPIGAPLGNTADIDCSATGVKTGAPVATLTLEPGPYAWGIVVNQASGSTFTALDTSDGTAQQSWGFASTDMFGLLTGVYFNGTYGTWPTFANTATFATSFGAIPAMSFVAGTPS